MKEKTKPVYVGSKTHGKLKKLVGVKAEAGFKASIRSEVEEAVDAHLNRKQNDLSAA